MRGSPFALCIPVRLYLGHRWTKGLKHGQRAYERNSSPFNILEEPAICTQRLCGVLAAQGPPKVPNLTGMVEGCLASHTITGQSKKGEGGTSLAHGSVDKNSALTPSSAPSTISNHGQMSGSLRYDSSTQMQAGRQCSSKHVGRFVAESTCRLRDVHTHTCLLQ